MDRKQHGAYDTSKPWPAPIESEIDLRTDRRAISLTTYPSKSYNALMFGTFTTTISTQFTVTLPEDGGFVSYVVKNNVVVGAQILTPKPVPEELEFYTKYRLLGESRALRGLEDLTVGEYPIREYETDIDYLGLGTLETEVDLTIFFFDKRVVSIEDLYVPASKKEEVRASIESAIEATSKPRAARDQGVTKAISEPEAGHRNMSLEDNRDLARKEKDGGDRLSKESSDNKVLVLTAMAIGLMVLGIFIVLLRK